MAALLWFFGCGNYSPIMPLQGPAIFRLDDVTAKPASLALSVAYGGGAPISGYCQIGWLRE